jgi:hypothetical protein
VKVTCFTGIGNWKKNFLDSEKDGADWMGKRAHSLYQKVNYIDDAERGIS